MNELDSLKKENEKLKSELEKLKKEKNNLKKGMERRAKEGNIVSRSPFGYKIYEGKLVKAENWQVVENIFREFQNSEISLNHLAKKYGFSINGLKKILRNFTYLGKVKFDGEIHNASHEPLVSSTLFNHVQDELERKGIRT